MLMIVIALKEIVTLAIVNLNQLPGNNIIGIRRDNVMLLICNIII